MTWSGAASDMEPGAFLKPILQEALDAALAEQAVLEIDLRALRFINSSGIAHLARFLGRAQDAKQTVILIYNGETKWQEISLAPLGTLASADGLIQVRAMDPD